MAEYKPTMEMQFDEEGEELGPGVGYCRVEMTPKQKRDKFMKEYLSYNQYGNSKRVEYQPDAKILWNPDTSGGPFPLKR